jgi:hypothetical protein
MDQDRRDSPESMNENPIAFIGQSSLKQKHGRVDNYEHNIKKWKCSGWIIVSDRNHIKKYS